MLRLRLRLAVITLARCIFIRAGLGAFVPYQYQAGCRVFFIG